MPILRHRIHHQEGESVKLPRAKTVPLFPDDFKIPESQIRYPDYPVVHSPVLGQLVFTGGFMEPEGHNYKPFYTYALFSDQPRYVQLPYGQRNLGIDYVIADYQIRNWYPATVTTISQKPGYGNYCQVVFDQRFRYQGQDYTVYGSYAKAHEFTVRPEQKLAQGEVLGTINPELEDSFVDLRLWIVISTVLPKIRVDISPNLIEAQWRSTTAVGYPAH